MPESKESRGARAAQRRKGTYLRRYGQAAGERQKIHALVWWWMAEIYRLSPSRRASEVRRLTEITTELNHRGKGDRHDSE